MCLKISAEKIAYKRILSEFSQLKVVAFNNAYRNRTIFQIFYQVNIIVRKLDSYLYKRVSTFPYNRESAIEYSEIFIFIYK